MSSSTFNESGLRWLVVGADGLIGQAVFTMLKARGADVVGTSRRIDTELIALDLAWPPAEWSLPVCDIALLCAGRAGVADCEANPHTSSYINVNAQVALAERIWRNGGFVVFLSSNSVFDGRSDVPGIDTQTAATHVYGQQKALAETILSQASLQRGLAIIRMTKVLARQTPLLQAWEGALVASQPIFPHVRRWMAPLHVIRAARVILAIAGSMQSGVWHISADEDISYADFAILWAFALGFSRSLVRPYQNNDLLPSRTRLNMDSTKSLFGIEALSINDVISDLRLEGSCAFPEEQSRS